jgi:G3E family GTPase
MAVPLHLLTGFLGAGKSTVLQRVLTDPRGERIAVLVNEVGERALDHHLLETLDANVHLLASGCICCTIEGELFEAVERVLALAPTRIVVETTGIAEPAPILRGLAAHPRLAHSVDVAGVIAVVDAERGEMLLDEPEARAQVELADRVILSKTDVAPGRVAALRARVLQHAPTAEVRQAVRGEVDVAWLLSSGPSSRWRDAGGARAWLHHRPDQGHRITTRTVDFGGPVDEEALALWLRLVTQLDGDRLLRVKGVVEGVRSGACLVMQSVQHTALPPRRLDARPVGWQSSALVMIARGASDADLDRWEALAREAAKGLRRSPMG